MKVFGANIAWSLSNAICISEHLYLYLQTFHILMTFPIEPHENINSRAFLGFFYLYTISKFIFKIMYYFPEDSDQQMFKQLFCEKNTMMNINGPCPYETYFIRF